MAALPLAINLDFYHHGNLALTARRRDAARDRGEVVPNCANTSSAAALVGAILLGSQSLYSHPDPTTAPGTIYRRLTTKALPAHHAGGDKRAASPGVRISKLTIGGAVYRGHRNERTLGFELENLNGLDPTRRAVAGAWAGRSTSGGNPATRSPVTRHATIDPGRTRRSRHPELGPSPLQPKIECTGRERRLAGRRGRPPKRDRARAERRERAHDPQRVGAK